MKYLCNSNNQNLNIQLYIKDQSGEMGEEEVVHNEEISPTQENQEEKPKKEKNQETENDSQKSEVCI